MSVLSDSSIHEDEDAIVAEYENHESDDDRRSLGRDENAGSENDESKEDKTTARRIDPTTSKKHVVRNPIPKLNTERLKGPKGLQTIENYFEGFKFHGKGHEKADLNKVMKRIEHWAHRLFPKLDFDDFLDRVEKLGTKKDLQVFIKKYRQDMLTLDNDLIVPENVDGDEDKGEDEPIDEFDMLIAEQIEKQKQVTIQQESSIHGTSTDKNDGPKDDAFDQLLSNTVNKISEPSKEKSVPSQLSDEVKERIERNRQQAIQRRLARLKALQETKQQKLEETKTTSLSGENNVSQTCETNVSDKDQGEAKRMKLEDLTKKTPNESQDLANSFDIS